MAALASLPLSLSILPLSSSSSFRPDWERTTWLSLRWGSHNWRGSQFLPLCANGGALRRPPKAFDDIRRAHSYIQTPTQTHTSFMASVSLWKPGLQKVVWYLPVFIQTSIVTVDNVLCVQNVFSNINVQHTLISEHAVSSNSTCWQLFWPQSYTVGLKFMWVWFWVRNTGCSCWGNGK